MDEFLDSSGCSTRAGSGGPEPALWDTKFHTCDPADCGLLLQLLPKVAGCDV